MIPCTVSIYGAVQNCLTAEDAFCMGKCPDCMAYLLLKQFAIRKLLIAAVCDTRIYGCHKPRHSRSPAYLLHAAGC
eukprot:COSAG01_NODE_346_length_18524_cov_35.929661_9_plen_76_part_00